jgi:hypothetical protein
VEGDEVIGTLLHTAAYRTLMSPTIYSEPGVVGGGGGSSGGPYVGLDGKLHSADADVDALGGCGAGGQAGGSDDAGASFAARWAVGAQALARAHVSDLSLWDTFRTMNPWLLLTQQPIAMGLLRSFAAMTEQQGAFPRWSAPTPNHSTLIGVNISSHRNVCVSLHSRKATRQ